MDIIDLTRSGKKTSKTYTQVIKALRNQPDTSPFYANEIRRINVDPSSHSMETMGIVLRSGSHSIVLIIRLSDLYVLGFYNYASVYRFNDSGLFDLPQELGQAPRPVIELPFGGSYSQLERASGRSRTQLNVNLFNLQTAIRRLSSYGTGSVTQAQLAESMMLLIFSLIEASRFGDAHIVDNVARSLESDSQTWTPPNTAVELTNDWGRLSSYGYALAQDPTRSFDYEGTRISTLSSLAALIALLAYPHS